MPPKKDPLSQLVNEENAVNSPVRRSSRLNLNAANSPAPAPANLRGRRASQTDTTTTAKVTKPRRLSQAVDDKDAQENEVKPAPRARRGSQLVEEETKKAATPRKSIRQTRANSKSPTENKEEPKTTRAKKLASEEPKTPVKATRGRRSSVTKTEETEKEPTKVTTRGRRSSVTIEKDDIVEESKRTTRSRRSSVDNNEEVPPKSVGRRKSIADDEIIETPAKSTPIRGRRRLSVTESLVNMDPIIENEENSDKNTIKLTPIKKKIEPTILDPNLSIISENEDSPKRKLTPQKSTESTDLSEIKTPNKHEKTSPKKSLTEEEPHANSETDTIVSGTDGSFVFNLNVSIPNSDKTDLNTSKSSNGSDKENESINKNTPGKKSKIVDLKGSPVKIADPIVAVNRVEIKDNDAVKEKVINKNVEEGDKSMSEDYEFDLPSDNEDTEKVKVGEDMPKSPIIHSTRASLSRRQSLGKSSENTSISLKEDSRRSQSPPRKVVRRSLSHTSPTSIKESADEVEPMEVDDIFEEQVENEDPNTTANSINKESNRTSAAFSEGDTFCDMSKLVVEESDVDDDSSKNLTEEEEDKLLQDPEENDALLAKYHEKNEENYLKSSNVNEKLNEETGTSTEEEKGEIREIVKSPINKSKLRLSLNISGVEIKENLLNEIASSTENENRQVQESKPRTSQNNEKNIRIAETVEIVVYTDKTENETSHLEETDASFIPIANIDQEKHENEEKIKPKNSLNVSNILTDDENMSSDNKEIESNALVNEILPKSRLSLNQEAPTNEEDIAVNEKRRSRNSLNKISPKEEVREIRKSRNSLNISKMLPGEVKANGFTKNHNVASDSNNLSEKYENQEISNEKMKESSSNVRNMSVETTKIKDHSSELDDNLDEIESSQVKDNEHSNEKLNTSIKSSDTSNNDDKSAKEENSSLNVNSISAKEIKENGLEESRDIIAEKIDENDEIDGEEQMRKSRNSLNTSKHPFNNDEIEVNGLDDQDDDKDIEGAQEQMRKSRNSLNTSKHPFKNDEIEVNGLDDQDDDKDIEGTPQHDGPENQNRKSKKSLSTSKLSSKNEEDPKENGLDDCQGENEDIKDALQLKSLENQKKISSNSLNTTTISSKNEEKPKGNELDNCQEEIKDTSQQKSSEKQKKKSRNSLNTSTFSSKNEEEPKGNGLDDYQEEDEIKDTSQQKSSEKQKRKSSSDLNTSKLSSKNEEEPIVNGLNDDQEKENIKDTLQEKSEKKKKRKSKSSFNNSKLSSKNKEETKVNGVDDSQDKDIKDSPQKSPNKNETEETTIKKTTPAKQSKLQQLEDFANSKVDEYLQIKSLESKEESSEDEDYDPTEDRNRHEFLDDMAEECEEEESEYDDSNDIPCEGESIGSTEDEIGSSDEYDEEDSFICDEECNELISGDEYDLDDHRKEKKVDESKLSRIVTISDSSDDEELEEIRKKVDPVKEQDNSKKREQKKHNKENKYRVIVNKGEYGETIKIESKAKKVDKSPKISRIITVSDSSDDEELKKMREDVDQPVKEQDNSDFVNEVSHDESAQPAIANVAETNLNESRKRKASITIHENIRIDDLKDASLSERINLVVESFCSTVQKGEISMNLSLQYEDDSPSDKKENDTSVFVDYKPVTTNVAKKSPPQKRKSSSEAESSVGKRARTSLESIEPSTSKLNTSPENIKEKSNKKIKKRPIPIEKPKIKKKKGTKLKVTRHDFEDLRVDTFSLMNQEIITDIKNRKRRTIKPSVADDNSSWISEKQQVIKPSTSQVSKAEKLRSQVHQKVHAKDFKNQMLYDKSRVNRVETKTLLKKRGDF